MVSETFGFSSPEVSTVVPDLTELLVSFFAGYGGHPYGVHQAGLTPEATSAGQYSNDLNYSKLFKVYKALYE